MKKVVIIDYGISNLGSVKRAVEECGGNPVISCERKDLESAANLVLPGVGAFGKGIDNLCRLGLIEIIKEQVLEKGIPILGICLGMQLLASVGFEGGEKKGLDLIPGKVIKLNGSIDLRIPHIGWNEINFKKDCALFNNIRDFSDFYFAHSYHFICYNDEHIAAQTSYGFSFTSVIQKDNIFGTQFHPEKSLSAGFKILNNFISL